MVLSLLFRALSIAFLLLCYFGCTTGERDNPYDPGGTNYQGSTEKSSSSVRSSSSFGGVSTCGANFRTVEIGTQVWMAENLNCDVAGSKCYNNEPSNCAQYGRLYDWNTAMSVCPSGWHLPTNSDWDKLFRFVDGTNGTSSPYDSPTAGKHLKAKSGWSSCGPSGSGSSYLCEDTYGFSALPGGSGISDGSFVSVGYHGIWWSAGEGSSGYAYYRRMAYNYDDAGCNDGRSKDGLYSVRCLQD